MTCHKLKKGKCGRILGLAEICDKLNKQRSDHENQLHDIRERRAKAKLAGKG